ncbi:hypothetical protein FKP32DRAFT_1541826, partial [Trametes sanguinea]
AVFHTAAVWAWNSDLKTGNFVLPGRTAPPKALIDVLYCRQDKPGPLCQFSYAVDTYSDKSLYTVQKAFEDHILSQPEFNKGRKPRRRWQEGGGSFDATYIFTAPVFARRAPQRRVERRIKYEIPSPIRLATENPKVPYCANPDRPQIFEAVDGSLRDIASCDPAELQYGDMVWISFFVEFIVGTNAWNTNFVPVEIVRVATVSPDLVG